MMVYSHTSSVVDVEGRRAAAMREELVKQLLPSIGMDFRGARNHSVHVEDCGVQI
jgi:hypothetical protein